MKTKMTHSLLWKSLAFVLSLILMIGALLSIAGMVVLFEDNFYMSLGRDYTHSLLFRSAAYEFNYAAWQYHREGRDDPPTAWDYDYLEEKLDPANTNYRYAIFDADGKRLGGTAPADTSPEDAMRYGGSYSTFSSGDEPEYHVVGTLDPAMKVADAFAEQARLFNLLVSMRYWLIAIAALCALGMILLFIYLMCAAGRHADAEAPECRGLDRVPFDLYLAFAVGAIVLFTYLTVHVPERRYSLIVTGALVMADCVVAYAVLEALCMSLAARIKCRCLFRNTITAWLLLQLWRFVKWIGRGIRQLFVSLPILWKTLLGACGVLLIDLVLILVSQNSAFAFLLCLLFNIAVVALACVVTLQLRKLQKGARALAAGDFNYQIESAHMLPEIKEHAEALGGIRVGMGRAIEARMKSERMKTDLITNVSHDLKTPLTAIISYVDLLQKEKLPEAAKGYVSVLDQQAQRLKKLAEDVVEASKASSGTLNVNLQPTDLNEIVNQSLAEYSARLMEHNLSPILGLPEPPLIVQADGRLLWRAIDNLLSNAAKYALPGTRVYIRATGDGSAARLSIKNVSKEPLDADPAELTERFVRGDASRSADGSGLGLSIAQSLMTLQNGSLALSIDGDVFTAELMLPLA